MTNEELADLVKRLRDQGSNEDSAALEAEAADAIEALLRQSATVRALATPFDEAIEKLEPIARMGQMLNDPGFAFERALEPFLEIVAWAERNGCDLTKDVDMIQRTIRDGIGDKFGGHLGVQGRDFIALAKAWQAATPTPDLEERAIEAAQAAYDGAPDSHSQNAANVARAVLAAVGFK